MESFWSHFKGKNSYLFLDAANFEELEWVIARQMGYYNLERRHSSLGYRSPMEYLVSEGFMSKTLAENGLESSSVSGAQVRLRPARWPSLDRFRGLAVLSMLLVNFLSDFPATPGWLRHAPWNGYTFPDLVAPVFLFAMGVAYRISLRRRIGGGLGQTVRHFLRRYLILFLMGVIGTFIVSGSFSWGVLEMLGTVGLFAFPFMFLPAPWRLALSVSFASLYQVLRPERLVSRFDMGGPLAVPAWSLILILAATEGELIGGKGRESLPYLFLTNSALSLLGLALSPLVPLNKHLVSLSYVLLSAGLAGLIFTVFFWAERFRIRVYPLEILGKNALAIFIVGSILVLGGRALLPCYFPFLSLFAISLVPIGLCLALAAYLDRKGIYIKL